MVTKVKKKLIGMMLMLALSLSCVAGCGGAGQSDDKENVQTDEGGEMNEKANLTAVSHEIPAGISKSGNPLKGLIPFQGSETDFPHSMDWFYIPVSAVQVSTNIFDWNALEEKLNLSAEQGNQAVLRFYYDYPGEESGVPEFLIDKGLKMRPYNEPDDLGGGGLCPDYSDENLRESMKNFIKAFGAKYDGDARIGFITEGLLGFWGEWHNWPFDEDLSDGKPDWSIPVEVYEEVYETFDEAFKITPLLVREPKPGIDNARYNAGYHDDSFAYATLTAANGGQEWSFGQKVENLGETEKWKTNCIGGEVYPPIQPGLFNDPVEYPEWIEQEGRQDFATCVQNTHASWLMCDRIKIYRDEARENAIKASDSLGYDLQVTEATFLEEVSAESMEVEVSIKNIGVAPFYYDHTKWPVTLGIKKDGNLVKKYKTEWDLCDIPADGNEVSFTHNIEKHNLGGGEYTLCMKVQNPLPGGKLLFFANEGQEDDGWLTLGTVTILGPEMELDVIEEVPPIVYVEPEPVEDGVDGYFQAENGRIEGLAIVDRDVPECMGGRKVGYIGKEGGSLYMENVEAPEDGLYEVEFTYITKEERYVKVSVNEGEDVKIDFPPSGEDWTTLGTFSVEFELKKGLNTFYFHNETGWAPDFDCIRLIKK